MLSSSVNVCPSGCTCSEQKYSEHAGHGLSLGALFSSSQRKWNRPKHLLQYLAANGLEQLPLVDRQELLALLHTLRESQKLHELSCAYVSNLAGQEGRACLPVPSDCSEAC